MGGAWKQRMGWLKVLNGDEEESYSWTAGSPEEIRAAREKFNLYMKRGFIACKIVNQGKTGVQIAEFDPGAEEIFMLGLTEGG
jgi:hypothetical protein